MGRGGGSASRSSGSSGSRSSGSRSGGSSHGSRASFSSGRSRGYGGSSSSGGSSSFKRGSSGGGGSRSQAQAPMRSRGRGPAPAPRSHGRRGFGLGHPSVPGGFIGYAGGAPRRSYGGGGGCGCLAGLTTLIALLVAAVLFIPASCTRLLSGGKNSASDADQSPVTLQTSHTREKLAADACVESDQWLDDQAGWLDDQKTVTDAMRSFYEQTGVQPYLIIADGIDGNKDYALGDVETYLRDRYDELFDDDGHLILLFCEPYENEYEPFLLVGEQAQQVVDTDGENIIYDAVDHWYTDTSLSDDEYFARVFVASANALMYGTSFDEFG